MEGGTHICSEEQGVLPVVCHNDECHGSLCEDLLTEMACTSALDAVQVLVDSMIGKYVWIVDETRQDIYSSAPSMVTSMVGYWSTSPSRRSD